MIYYLPFLYHRSVSEIDIPQGPDAQHFAWTSTTKVKNKTKQNKDTPQICNTESGSCTLTTVTTLQINYSATKHRQEVEAQERNGVPALSSASLTLDAIPSLEAEQAGVPLPDWGEVDTAWHGALCWTIFKGPLSAMFWLGPESYMAWRPLGIWRQDSANLDLSWHWGSQLKPPSWEGSLLGT